VGSDPLIRSDRRDDVIVTTTDQLMDRQRRAQV
jgi:hypothetical protein